jgi:hypothetical protein
VAASNHHFWLVTAGLSLLADYFWLFTSGFSLLAFHFWLFTSGSSLKLLFALLETTNRFDS